MLIAAGLTLVWQVVATDVPRTVESQAGHLYVVGGESLASYRMADGQREWVQPASDFAYAAQGKPLFLVSSGRLLMTEEGGRKLAIRSEETGGLEKRLDYPGWLITGIKEADDKVLIALRSPGNTRGELRALGGPLLEPQSTTGLKLREPLLVFQSELFVQTYWGVKWMRLDDFRPEPDNTNIDNPVSQFCQRMLKRIGDSQIISLGYEELAADLKMDVMGARTYASLWNLRGVTDDFGYAPSRTWLHEYITPTGGSPLAFARQAYKVKEGLLLECNEGVYLVQESGEVKLVSTPSLLFPTQGETWSLQHDFTGPSRLYRWKSGRFQPAGTLPLTPETQTFPLPEGLLTWSKTHLSLHRLAGEMGGGS